MIKIESQIHGIVHACGPVKPTKRDGKYFKQVVIIHEPQEEYKGHKMPEEWWVISIISTSESDSRFLKPEDKGSVKTATVYLKGERWDSGNRGEYTYNHKLNLVEWQP